MIKAIEAYKLMCEAIQKQRPTVTESIEKAIIDAANLGLQTAVYTMPEDMEESQMKAIVSSIRCDGYLVQRTSHTITISW